MLTQLMLLLALGIGEPAAAGDGPSASAPATVAPTEAARIASFWARVFAPPGAHAYELSLAAGQAFAESSYGSRTATRLLRLALVRGLGDLVPDAGWLAATLVADWTRDTGATDALTITADRMLVGLKVGLLRWQGRYRLEAGLEGGPLVRWTSLHDSAGTRERNLGFSPLVGVTGGLGVAVAGVAVVGLAGGLRYHPGRVDLVLVFEVGWLVGSSAVPQQQTVTGPARESAHVP